ncbi:hypothetical protein EJ04DRAFT_26050 [Polyplosphaeria fusca]|uniref:Uncharacterized protein n=1 Tax=Polyplosphaeria fusca TaxID=682080 RepID=A0A9P4R4T2_9PLEO|nr:hypothetical protein EJ04DRAFT_26050 [Polyplosphaeria fusca]
MICCSIACRPAFWPPSLALLLHGCMPPCLSAAPRPSSRRAGVTRTVRQRSTAATGGHRTRSRIGASLVQPSLRLFCRCCRSSHLCHSQRRIQTVYPGLAPATPVHEGLVACLGLTSYNRCPLCHPYPLCPLCLPALPLLACLLSVCPPCLPTARPGQRGSYLWRQYVVVVVAWSTSSTRNLVARAGNKVEGPKIICGSAVPLASNSILLLPD